MVGYHLRNVVFAFVGFDSEIVQLAAKRDKFLPLGQNIFSRSARTIFFSFYTRRDKICLPNLA
jgi:hypothetical protein